jgi:hypothetical protein
MERLGSWPSSMAVVRYAAERSTLSSRSIPGHTGTSSKYLLGAAYEITVKKAA